MKQSLQKLFQKIINKFFVLYLTQADTDHCNGCDNLGCGLVDAFYEPYINGEKELRQLNEEYRSNSGIVK